MVCIIFNDDLSNIDDIGFQDSTAGVVQMIVFRVVTPCKITMIRRIMLLPSSGWLNLVRVIQYFVTAGVVTTSSHFHIKSLLSFMSNSYWGSPRSACPRWPNAQASPTCPGKCTDPFAQVTSPSLSLFVISLISVCLFICLSLLPLFILSCSLLLESFCSVIDSSGNLRRLSERIEPRYIIFHLMWQLFLCQVSLSYPWYFAYGLLFFFLLSRSIYQRFSLLVNLPCIFCSFMLYLVNCNWVWHPVTAVQYTTYTQTIQRITQ